MRGMFRSSLARSERGSVAIITAMVLICIVGSVGLVIDVGYARSEKIVLQTVAEAAAIAAAEHLPNDPAAAKAAAIAYAKKNYPASVSNVVKESDVEFGDYEAGVFTPRTGGSSLRVTASRTRAKGNQLGTFLIGALGYHDWNVSAQATVLAGKGMPLCIILLHKDKSDAFDIDGGAEINAPGCQVTVNSRHSGALEVSSGARVNLASLNIVGGADISSHATVNPRPVTGAAPAVDPYASLAPPVNNNCGGTDDIDGRDTTLYPTKAFCNGLEIDDAVVTFMPGIYVIKDELTVKSGGHIKGTDVMIYLQGDGSDMFFYSGSSFELTAPKTGPYAGIVLWSDKANDNDHDFYSKIKASAQGTIYTPNSQIEFEDNVVWESDCIRIVAAYLELDNDSKYKGQNPDANCDNNIYESEGIKLVR